MDQRRESTASMKYSRVEITLEIQPQTKFQGIPTPTSTQTNEIWHIWKAPSSLKFAAAETGRNCTAVATLMCRTTATSLSKNKK